MLIQKMKLFSALFFFALASGTLAFNQNELPQNDPNNLDSNPDVTRRTEKRKKRNNWRQTSAAWRAQFIQEMEAKQIPGGKNVFQTLVDNRILYEDGRGIGAEFLHTFVLNPQQAPFAGCSSEQFGSQGEHTELVCDFIEDFKHFWNRNFFAHDAFSELFLRAIKGDILGNTDITAPTFMLTQGVEEAEALKMAQELAFLIENFVPRKYDNELLTSEVIIRVTNYTHTFGELEFQAPFPSLGFGDGSFKQHEWHTKYDFENYVQYSLALNLAMFLVSDQGFPDENSGDLFTARWAAVMGYFFENYLRKKKDKCELHFLVHTHTTPFTLCASLYGAKKFSKRKSFAELMEDVAQDLDRLKRLDKRLCPSPSCEFLEFQ